MTIWDLIHPLLWIVLAVSFWRLDKKQKEYLSAKKAVNNQNHNNSDNQVFKVISTEDKNE